MYKRRNRGAFKSIDYKNIAYFFNNAGSPESFYRENHSIVNGIPTVLNYADLPSAFLYTNKVFRVLNVGVRGSLWFSNGVKWVLSTKSVILALVTTPVPLTAGAQNYRSMFSYLFPTNGTESLLRIGDRFRLTMHFNKLGTADTLARGYSIGATTNSGLHPNYTSPVNGQADSSVVTIDASGPSAATNTSYDERHEFIRLNASTIKKIGGYGSTSIVGINSSGLDIAVADLATATPPITNIDLTPIYFNVCYGTNASDAGSLKFLMLELLSYSGN